MTAYPTIAVIGLGNISRRHRKNLRQLHPAGRILALSSSGRVPQETVSDADEVCIRMDEILASRPRFAIIASPATFHARDACALLDAGIPVLIEKPLAASSADACAIVEARDRTHGIAAVGYCLRYMPAARLVRSLIIKGTLGTIHSAQIVTGQYLPEWRPGDFRKSVSARKDLGGGALLELSHELDYVRWFLGRQRAIHARLRNTPELSLEVEEIANVVLAGESGTLATVHLDFLQKPACRRVTLIGSQGRLEWNAIENSVRLHLATGTETLLAEPQWDRNLMYIEMLRDFDAMISGQANNCITLEEATETVFLIDSIKEMARP